MHDAEAVAAGWRGGDGVVPRGPKVVLGSVPVDRSEVEARTGRTPTGQAWRVEIGGRFLCSRGLVYPGGVPYPDELQRQTALVASEVWLYVDEASGYVLGTHWWPDAMRRPIASIPVADYPDDAVCAPGEWPFPFGEVTSEDPRWPVRQAVVNGDDAVVLFLNGLLPDPLNDMVVFADGGLVLDIGTASGVDLGPVEPPYRTVDVGGAPGVGRDVGRALGPQTWPWPGEVRWRAGDVLYRLRGFEVATELAAVGAGLTPA